MNNSLFKQKLKEIIKMALCLIFNILLYVYMQNTDGRYRKQLAFIFIIISSYIFLSLLIKAFIVPAIKRLFILKGKDISRWFSRVKKLIHKTLTKIGKGLGLIKDGEYIEGEDYYSYDFTVLSEQRKRRNIKQTKKKFHEPDDAKGKIRFFYKSFVWKNIRNGAPIKQSDTPNEIYNKTPDSTDCEIIFSLYNEYRYSSRVPDADICEKNSFDKIRKMIK